MWDHLGIVPDYLTPSRSLTSTATSHMPTPTGPATSISSTRANGPSVPCANTTIQIFRPGSLISYPATAARFFSPSVKSSVPGRPRSEPPSCELGPKPSICKTSTSASFQVSLSKSATCTTTRLRSSGPGCHPACRLFRPLTLQASRLSGHIVEP